MRIHYTMFLISALSGARRLGLWRTCAGALCWAAASAQAALPIQHWTQANGARVYLVSSPAIPMLDVSVDVDAGSRRDPATQAGLARATASMLDKGVQAAAGQPALDENALAEAWLDIGAQFGASASSDRMGFALRSLTEPALLARATALAARQLAHPAFPEAVWVRDRERSLAALREAGELALWKLAIKPGKPLTFGHFRGVPVIGWSVKRMSNSGGSPITCALKPERCSRSSALSTARAITRLRPVALA